MTRDYMCQYGNCEETDTPIKVSAHGQRPRFCCEEHAAAWLIQWAIRTSQWPDERARQAEYQIADAIKYVRRAQYVKEYGEDAFSAIAQAKGE